MSVGNGEHVISTDCLMLGEDKRRSRLPSVEEAKERFFQRGLPCPLCKTPPEQFSWIYLVIPPWASKDAEKKAGWLIICDRCKLKIDFFAEID
jgi:hypothetical protein